MNNITINSLERQQQGTQGGASRLLQQTGGAPGGLSILNKVCNNSSTSELGNRRKILLRNFRTGEIIIQDPVITRIRRMQKRVIAWAKQTDVAFPKEKGFITQMVTLTYKPGAEWSPNDIREFEQKVRLEMKGHLVAYAWVGELQKRGAVHYHFILISDGKKIRHPDKTKTWKHGMTKVEIARTKFYLVKYVGKEYQKKGIFPKNFRMYGIYANADRLGRAGIYELRITTVPKWLNNQIENDRTQRMLASSLLPDGLGFDPDEITWHRNTKGGGGWYLNGELLYSDWMYQGLGDWVGEEEPIEDDSS